MLKRNYFRKLLLGSLTLIFTVLALSFFTVSVYAQPGILRQMNFQGKLVGNPSGNNVSNGTYSVVFTIYDNSTGGTALWAETQNVTTVDGVFRVNLGSVTPFPSGMNFNWGGLYLGIKVGTDAEMTPRILLSAVPYAFNAEKVSGLTIQDTSGNASTSGTLQVANGVTVKLPSSGTGLIYADTATTGNISTLTNSTTQTGSVVGLNLTLSGATSNFNQYGIQFNLSGTTSGNQFDMYGTGGNWYITSAGALHVASCVGCGTTGPGGASFWQDVGGAIAPLTTTDDLVIGGSATSSATFHVFGSQSGGTNPVVSISANTSKSGLIIDQAGVGDLFTASYSGSTRFTISQTGTVYLGKSGTANGGLTFYSSGASITAPTISSDVNGNLILSATNTGSTVQVGSGTGNISLSLSRAQDGLVADKTISLGAAYTGQDYIFKRVFTGGSYGQGGSLLYVTDTSGGSGTINPDLILAESALTSGTFTGNLLRLRAAGADQLTVSAAGNITTLGVLGFNGTNPSITNTGTNTLTINSGSTGNIQFFSSNNTLTSAGALTLSSTVTSAGKITAGNLTNGLVFDPTAGPSYTGTGRPTKVITLSAEYAGATLTANGSGTTNGSMTSDNTLNAGNIGWMNYYQWTSTQASLQDYTIAVVVTLPQDFSGWLTGTCPGTSCAMDIEYQTGVTGTTNNAVSAVVDAAGSGATTTYCTLAAASSTTWSGIGCTSTNLASWVTPGSQAVILIKVAANSTASALARVGDINLRYYAKF